MDIQKLVTSGPFGYFRHPIYVGFIGSTVSLSFLLDCLYRWHCDIGCCMRWHCRIGTCMPFARACPLAPACDSLLHALLVALPHSRLHVIVVHLIVAFALASINHLPEACMRVCVVVMCVRVCFGGVCGPIRMCHAAWRPPHERPALTYTHTHTHTRSLIGVGISSGYIVGHVMPVEEEWVRPTLSTLSRLPTL